MTTEDLDTVELNATLDALAVQAVDNAIERAGTTRAEFLEDFPAQAPAWIESRTELVRGTLKSAVTGDILPPDLSAMAAEERWVARDMEIDRAAERWKGA